MYRLLHATRMPIKCADSAESFIEQYHQDSLDAGSRIRDGLSQAVEDSILLFANGFLNNPHNNELRKQVIENDNFAQEFYETQLNLIYRLLFLMVIEERDLVYPKTQKKMEKDTKEPISEYTTAGTKESKGNIL